MSEIRSYVFLAVIFLVGLVACGAQQSSTEAGADGASAAVAALAEEASPAMAKESGDAASAQTSFHIFRGFPVFPGPCLKTACFLGWGGLRSIA